MAENIIATFVRTGSLCKATLAIPFRFKWLYILGVSFVNRRSFPTFDIEKWIFALGLYLVHPSASVQCGGSSTERIVYRVVPFCL